MSEERFQNACFSHLAARRWREPIDRSVFRLIARYRQ
jgi:hypothetical protein